MWGPLKIWKLITNFHIFSGTRLYQTQDALILLNESPVYLIILFNYIVIINLRVHSRYFAVHAIPTISQ